MFTTNPRQIRGWMLPPKTLTFTFDDGPGLSPDNDRGPKTLALARYLRQQDITATFFFVGRSVSEHPEIVREVAELRHIVGNHTYSHPQTPNIVETFQKGEDITLEITKTTDLIRQFASNNTVYFRAPYGAWVPEISQHLNSSLKDGIEYIGPFFWDIDIDDWSFWRDGRPAFDCAVRFLAQINRIGRGIVLMHDSSADDENARRNNQTFDTVQILVPMLRALEYTFIGLDEMATAFNLGRV